MTQSSKIKLEIIQKIEQFSNTKLVKVLSFVKELDSDEERKNRILSFAGIWEDMDKEVLDELTIHLHENRKRDIREF